MAFIFLSIILKLIHLLVPFTFRERSRPEDSGVLGPECPPLCPGSSEEFVQKSAGSRTGRSIKWYQHNIKKGQNKKKINPLVKNRWWISPSGQASVGPLTLLRRTGCIRVVCSTGHLTMVQGYRGDGTLSDPHRTFIHKGKSHTLLVM